MQRAFPRQQLTNSVLMTHTSDLSLANHMHCFVSLDGIYRALNGPKPVTGNNALLGEAVILLDDVVQIG
jgi:hypothetical protein